MNFLFWLLLGDIGLFVVIALMRGTQAGAKVVALCVALLHAVAMVLYA